MRHSADPFVYVLLGALLAIVTAALIVFFAAPSSPSGSGSGSGSAAVSASASASEEQQQPQPQEGAAPPSKTIVFEVPSVRDPWGRPYHYPYGWDPLNRDPVCHGDPVCRDAYFRDWPYARRPRYHHHHHHGRHRDSHHGRHGSGNVTQQQTQNVNVSVPPPPPPADRGAILPEGSTTTASAPSMPSAGGIAGTTPPMNRVIEASVQLKEPTTLITAAPSASGEVAADVAQTDAAEATIQEPGLAMLTETAAAGAPEEADAQRSGSSASARRQCRSPLSCGGGAKRARSVAARGSPLARHEYMAMPY